MRTRSIALAAVFSACVAAWACGSLENTNDPCSTGTDCLPPYVCCTNPRIPAEGQSIPYCESTEYCDGYLPFLVEGNPCGR